VRRTIVAAFYWLAAITITLGAYGHGFLGIKPVRAAIEASTLPPDIVGVIWIVWYFVSGCMVAFGALLFWAWPALKTGSSVRSGAALIVGVFYAIVGVACFVYSGRDVFWLLFVTQGVIVVVSTLVLGAAQGSGQS
jgi:hypothetical protein